MADEKDTGGTVWDAPNQQVVRPDQSAPWEEGSGGEGLSDEEAASQAAGQEGEAEGEKPKRGRPRKTQEKDE